MRTLRTPGGGSAPAWSPTADVIAYLEPRGPNSTRVAFVDASGQALYRNLPPVPASPGFPVGLTWAPDGRRLACAIVDSLWIIEPDAPQPFRKIAGFPASERPRGVTWTRDGSALIVAVEEARGDIVVFDRE